MGKDDIGCWERGSWIVSDGKFYNDLLLDMRVGKRESSLLFGYYSFSSDTQGAYLFIFSHPISRVRKCLLGMRLQGRPPQTISARDTFQPIILSTSPQPSSSPQTVANDEIVTSRAAGVS